VLDGGVGRMRRLQSDDRVRHVSPDYALAATVTAMRSLAADTMFFAGVDSDEAERAIQREDADLDVRTPAPTPRAPFKTGWQPWERMNKALSR
jgi:hypothetical protein